MSTRKKWGKKVFEDFFKRSESTEGSICKFKDQITFGTNPNDVPLRRERVYERTIYKISKTDQNFSKPQTKNEDRKRESIETISDRHQLLAEIEKNLKDLNDQKKLLMASANDSKQKKTWSENLSKDYSAKHRKNSCRKDCDHKGDICSVLQKFLEKNCVKVSDSSTQIGSPVRHKNRLSSLEKKKDSTSNDMPSSSLEDHVGIPRKQGGVKTVNSGIQVGVSHLQHRKKKKPNDRPQESHVRNCRVLLQNTPYTDFTSESLIKKKSWSEKEVKTKTVYRKNIFTSPRPQLSSNQKSPRASVQSSAKSPRSPKEEINQTLLRSRKISKEVTNSIESLYEDDMRQSARTSVSARKSSRPSRDIDAQNRRRRRSKSRSLTSSPQPLQRAKPTKDRNSFSVRRWTLQHSRTSSRNPSIMQRASERIPKEEKLQNVKDTIPRNRIESDNISELNINSANENPEDVDSSFSEYHDRPSRGNTFAYSNPDATQTLNFIRPNVIDDNTYTMPQDSKDYIILPYNRIAVGLEASPNSNEASLNSDKKDASVEPEYISPGSYQKPYAEQRGTMQETLRQSLKRESSTRKSTQTQETVRQSLKRESNTRKSTPNPTYYQEVNKAKPRMSHSLSLQENGSENREYERSTSTRLSLQNQINKSHPETIAPSGLKSNQLQEEAVDPSNRLNKLHTQSIAPSGFKSNQLQEEAVEPSNRFSRTNGSMQKPVQSVPIKSHTSPEMIKSDAISPRTTKKDSSLSESYNNSLVGASSPKPSRQQDKSMTDMTIELKQENNVENNFRGNTSVPSTYPPKNSLNSDRNSGYESMAQRRDSHSLGQQKAREDQSYQKPSSQYNSEATTLSPILFNEPHTLNVPSSKDPQYISESTNKTQSSYSASEELERPNQVKRRSSNSSQNYLEPLYVETQINNSQKSTSNDVSSNKYEPSYEIRSSNPSNEPKSPPQFAYVSDTEKNYPNINANTNSSESAETKMSADWKTQPNAQSTLISGTSNHYDASHYPLNKHEPLPEPQKGSMLIDPKIQVKRPKTNSSDSLDVGPGRKSNKSEHRSLTSPPSNEQVSMKNRGSNRKGESPKARNTSSGSTSATLLVGVSNGADKSNAIKKYSQANTLLKEQDLQKLPRESFSKNNSSTPSSPRQSSSSRRRSSSLPLRSQEIKLKTEPATSLTESNQSGSLPRHSNVIKSKPDRVSNYIVKSEASETPPSRESYQNYGSNDRKKSSALSPQSVKPNTKPFLPKTCASLETLENQRFTNKDLAINDSNKQDKKYALKSFASEGSISTFGFTATFFKNCLNTGQTSENPALNIEGECAKHSGLKTENSLATSSQENEFLSDSQNLNANIKGIDSEIQNFIQYLQNRLRDCDKMVKKQLDLQEEVARKLNENRSMVEHTEGFKELDKKDAPNSSKKQSDLKTESSLALATLSQDDEFLSESKNQNAPIEGIDSELQNFIQYLQNRLRDCDKMVKNELARQANVAKKLRESRAQVEDTGRFEEVAIVNDEKFDSDCTDVSEVPAKEKYVLAMNEEQMCIDRSSESEFSFEYSSCEQDDQTPDHSEIPPFFGCNCMKKDYYRIMRLAYCID